MAHVVNEQPTTQYNIAVQLWDKCRLRRIDIKKKCAAGSLTRHCILTQRGRKDDEADEAAHARRSRLADRRLTAALEKPSDIDDDDDDDDVVVAIGDAGIIYILRIGDQVERRNDVRVVCGVHAILAYILACLAMLPRLPYFSCSQDLAPKDGMIDSAYSRINIPEPPHTHSPMQRTTDVVQTMVIGCPDSASAYIRQNYAQQGTWVVKTGTYVRIARVVISEYYDDALTWSTDVHLGFVPQD
ncbi:hypothetical protein PG987_016228 [Apiospora arundinis]